MQHLKPDEASLARDAIARHGRKPEARGLMLDYSDDPRVAIMPSGERIDWNRGLYILEKWDRKGWWDYGVSLRAGWLTDAGLSALQTTLAATSDHLSAGG